jgi:hypothetical protein
MRGQQTAVLMLPTNKAPAFYCIWSTLPIIYRQYYCFHLNISISAFSFDERYTTGSDTNLPYQ